MMERLSISNESDQSEIARIVGYNHHIREVIRGEVEIFLNFKRGLLRHLQEQQIDENPILQNNGTFFDTVQIESLNEQVTSSKIQLALVGPNSCGKTTFLHFLLRSGNFLPSDVGPVSARVIRLTYADAENAALYVYQSLTDRRIGQQVNLQEYFVNRQEPDWDGMKTAIKDHVTRPDAAIMTPDSNAFAIWAESFVEIRIPSSFLKLGIDIYDTPGLLFSDAPVLKDNLCQLVKLVKPTLVFLYENPAINSDARDCFLAVKDAIGPFADVSMFFLNTKADIDRIIADADPNNLGIDDAQIPEIFSNERQKRYQLLVRVPCIVSEFLAGLPNSIDECSCFDIVSVFSDLDELAAELNQTTINRIIQFTANADLRIARRVSQLVLPMIDVFFDLALSTNHRTIPQFRKLLTEAVQWSENYYGKYRTLIEQLLIELYNNISEHLDRETDEIARRAACYQSNNQIDNYIKTAVQQEIIKIEIKKIRQKYTDSNLLDQLTDVSLLKIAQKNEFLIAAQRHSNWLFESQIKSLDKKSTRQIFAEQTVLAQILLISDILVESNDHDPRRPSLSKYNQLFTRRSSLGRDIAPFDFAKERLKEVSAWLVDQKTYINEIIDTGYFVEKEELIQRIGQYYNLAEKSLGERKKLHHLVSQYSESFASIQCKIVSILNLAKVNGKMPTIDQLQKEFLIKQTSDCLEVHYHLQMRRLTIPNILPIINLYEDERSKSLWICFPNYFHRLTEVNLTIDNVFEIAYDLADSLAHLHFHEIVHGDIRVENIFLDDVNQGYLANFNYNRGHRLASHDDIYAFGQLGKFLYDRIMNSKDLMVSGEDFDNLEKLQQLFSECWHADVRLRPSAVTLLQKIVDIRKTL